MKVGKMWGEKEDEWRVERWCCEEDGGKKRSLSEWGFLAQPVLSRTINVINLRFYSVNRRNSHFSDTKIAATPPSQTLVQAPF